MALTAAEEFATAEGLDQRGKARLAVVVEELVSNAVRHGFGEGPIAIALTLTAAECGIAIALEDDGIAFDPTGRRDFDGPDAETGGGVGLALVRAWSNSLRYTREGGRNRIDLVLRLV